MVVGWLVSVCEVGWSRQATGIRIEIRIGFRIKYSVSTSVRNKLFRTGFCAE
jgi:hypothetical protein